MHRTSRFRNALLVSLPVSALLGACATAPAAVTPSAAATASPASTPSPSGTAEQNAQVPHDSAIMMAELTPQQGQLSDLLKMHVAKAKALHRTPYVELSATWCENCVLLEKSMKDPQVVDAFAGTYLVRLDIDQWDKTQLRTLGLSADAGVPAIYAVDSAAKGTGPDITVALPGNWAAADLAPPLKKYFTEHRWQ